MCCVHECNKYRIGAKHIKCMVLRVLKWVLANNKCMFKQLRVSNRWVISAIKIKTVNLSIKNSTQIISGDLRALVSQGCTWKSRQWKWSRNDAGVGVKTKGIVEWKVQRNEEGIHSPLQSTRQKVHWWIDCLYKKGYIPAKLQVTRLSTRQTRTFQGRIRWTTISWLRDTHFRNYLFPHS